MAVIKRLKDWYKNWERRRWVNKQPLYLVTPTQPKAPRGIRNNNPGNIRHGEKWKGRRPLQDDIEFVQFSDVKYGIRAMVRILRTYKKKYKIDTIYGLVSRWAPSNENDTQAYIRHVAANTGIPAREKIDLESPEILQKVLPALILHENGTQPYSEEVINTGIALGLI